MKYMEALKEMIVTNISYTPYDGSCICDNLTIYMTLQFKILIA